MEVHLGYRVSKECYSFYQTVSNGENSFSHFSSHLKDNFITRLFTQTFYFSKSLLESEVFLNLSLIFFEHLKRHSDKTTNINITVNREKKDTKAKSKEGQELEEKESEKKKKQENKNPLAFLGLLAVPVIVTVGLLWASVYNQPFFKECKELEKLLLADNLEQARLKVCEYCESITNYNVFFSGDAKQVAKENLEKSLEVLIYNQKLIEKKSEVMNALFAEMHEENPYKLLKYSEYPPMD